MLTHEELVQKGLSNPAVKATYKALAEDFAVRDESVLLERTSGEPVAVMVSYQTFQPGMTLKIDNYNDTMVEKILNAAEEPLTATMTGEELSAWLNSLNPQK
jgi:hypothetical protein